MEDSKLSNEENNKIFSENQLKILLALKKAYEILKEL